MTKLLAVLLFAVSLTVSYIQVQDVNSQLMQAGDLIAAVR